MKGKLQKIIFVIFVIESILILLGISFDVVSYGIDIQTPFMAFGILVSLIIGVILRLFFKSLNTKLGDIMELLLSAFMIFLSFYYVLEDQFRIII